MSFATVQHDCASQQPGYVTAAIHLTDTIDDDPEDKVREQSETF